MPLTNFEKRCNAYNEKHGLFSEGDKILVSCSGGKDSMVLIHLLIQLRIEIGLLYIDHNTRQGASKRDGEFIENFAQNHKIPFHLSSFNSCKEKSTKNSNFQESARNYRYKVLHEVAAEKGYTKIALGHNKDDNMETFFINLARGAGINGLDGISPKKGLVIRPILFASVEEIESYIVFNKIQHIHDKSNDENNYKRNFFRNEISPQLMTWDTNFLNAINQSINHLNEANQWLNNSIDNWTVTHCHSENEDVIIPFSALAKASSPSFLLYNILKKKGFNRTQTNEMLHSKKTGKSWQCEGFLAIIDRENILIRISKKGDVENKKYIYPFGTSILQLGTVVITKTNAPHKKNSMPLPLKVNLHSLCIRHWEAGDYMLFSYGRKKVKKIYVEKKVNVLEKKRYWMLCDQSRVYWIFGLIKSDLVCTDGHIVEWKQQSGKDQSKISD